ncbi:hypothetical protein ACFJIW_05250 [Tahibacter sp. UC22_41]|uniref:hypothetical protein n=1 Tax=Tahibacter sp. UC22_41 TaxID=3350178 RepID=UPI0036DB2B7B
MSARSGEFRNFCKNAAACYPVKPSLKIGSGRGIGMVGSDKVPPSARIGGAQVPAKKTPALGRRRSDVAKQATE